MKVDDLGTVLGEQPLWLLDAGAAHGIPDNWNYFLHLPTSRFVLVDPVGQTLSYASGFAPGKVNVVPTALSRSGGACEFFLANQSTGSSLLPPHRWPGRARIDNDYFFPLKILDIETTTLKACLDERNIGEIHAIKLDTQGTELPICQGLDERRLGRLLAAELEVSLYARANYLESPKLPEIIAWFEEQGFEFLNLRLNREELAPSGCVGPGFGSTIAAQYAGDALFVRDLFRTECGDSRDFELTLRRTLALLCGYYLHGEAIEVLRHAADRYRLEARMVGETEGAIRRFAAYQDQCRRQGMPSLWHRDAG